MIGYIMAAVGLMFAGIACISVFIFDHEEVKRDRR